VATSASTPAHAAGSYPPLTPVTGAPIMAYAPSVQYAGFWLRVVAYIIDGIVVGLVFLAMLVPFALTSGLAALAGRVHAGDEPRDIAEALGPVFFLGFLTIVSLAFLGAWLYHAKMESSSWQATLGKKVLNLRVTDMAGARVSFGKATGRHFAKIITGLIPLGIGFAMAGLTEKRQALHDMLASCLVLRDG